MELAKKELLLEGLDCANCAMKIENEVKKINGVTSCTVNFATTMMHIETAAGNEAPVMEEAIKRVNKLEPHIKVKEFKKKVSRGSAKARVEAAAAQDSASVSPHSGHSHGDACCSHDHADHDHSNKQNHGHAHEHGHDHEDEDDGHGHSHGNENTTRMIARLLASGAILAAGILAPVSGLAELAIFVAAYVIIGGDIVWRALRNIVRGRVFDENFLMAIATIGAFATQQYSEGVAVMLFYQIGELFQGIAVNRSRKSIKSLLDIRPDYANLKSGNEIIRVSPEEVEIGDIIVVRPGEKVPLDGHVVEGTSAMDTSALTGESVPREVEPGSEVLSGFINKNGVLTIEVTKDFGESTVSKILDLVQNASNKKAPTENFITKFARTYTPAVVIIALLLALIPPLVLADASFSDWIYRALVFLVISCPCALVVSIPLGFFGGIGAASKNGILVKGSNYLEALNDVKYVVFDKTGTLTKGAFTVTGIHPEGGVTENELLEYAAFAEIHSSHPIAVSVRTAYGKDIPETAIKDYNEISGHGIRVLVNGKEVLAGNGKLMKAEQISFGQPDVTGTLVHVAVNKQYAGYLAISDEPKADSANAIRQLKSIGIKRTVMLTGDAKPVAEAVGKQLGLDEVHAELLPQHKVEQIERLGRLKSPKEKIAFIGDGINDTPVLAQADVGIAMGGLGSDAAIEAADIVIMTDEPSKVGEAIHIAKRTRTIVWQNIFFAMGVKIIFLSLGAFGIATMWEAVFADVGVTLLAVLNAMRVMKVKSTTAA
jgi:Zn2+/Cd2+-exporting ATPase